MREWKPGDVAVVDLGGGSSAIALRVQGRCFNSEHRGHGVEQHWHLASGGWASDGSYLNARPLVVLDPEDREQVERLYDLIDAAEDRTLDERVDADEWARGAVQAALREFANPTPPKPDEPTGLGAVVEDAEGRRWIRVEPDGGIAKWVLSRAPEHTDPRYVWSAVPAVRVLSEGVTP